MLSLDKLFENLDITVHPFALCCAENGQALSLGPRDQATVHYVLEGTGNLSFGGFESFAVEAGAMIVAPAGAAQQLEGTGAPAQLADRVRQCRALDAGLIELGRHVSELGSGITMVCGSVDARYRSMEGIFDYLPVPIMWQSRENDTIWRCFNSIIDEMTRPRPGSRAMLRTLFQQCFIELLREHGAGAECRLPWLVALDKPRLSKAIEQIIDAPGRPYSLDSLADMCSMSRSTFAAQFTESFGRSAMDFVKEIRLRAAARMLGQTDQPIKSIAARVGYESRSHFSHAFTELFGASPAEYRESEGAK